VPALILMTSFSGFGVLCREAGFALTHAVFLTAAVWALPSQVVLIGAVGAGAGLVATALAVTLSAIRMAPMVAAWVPLVRYAGMPRWRLMLLAHFVAITAWVFSFMRLPKVPRPYRAVHFAGFAITLHACNIAITAASYTLAGALPPMLAGGLFFLTPLYFLAALTAAAKFRAEVLALAFGMVLGPLMFVAGLPLDIVWAGLIGGTAAFFGGRLIGDRREPAA
jgi:predicted branched-subunit amino acid permease